MKKFPKLKYAGFYKIDNLSDTAINAFITLNPHLKELEILCSFNLSISAINNISDRLPNLVKLGIDFKTLTISEYNEMVMRLAQCNN